MASAARRTGVELIVLGILGFGGMLYMYDASPLGIYPLSARILGIWQLKLLVPIYWVGVISGLLFAGGIVLIAADMLRPQGLGGTAQGARSSPLPPPCPPAQTPPAGPPAPRPSAPAQAPADPDDPLAFLRQQ